jgi:hypothetical protein
MYVIVLMCILGWRPLFTNKNLSTCPFSLKDITSYPGHVFIYSCVSFVSKSSHPSLVTYLSRVMSL